MTYMYVLADGTLPSPWARVTTWDGRYVRCASSGFGSVGGASTHRHLTVATNSGGAGQLSSSGVSGLGRLANHTHSINATYTSYSDNNPYYYTLSLWRMDASTWEASYRCFPAGAVVLSTGSISATGFARFTSADNRLVQLADPNSSGGRADHTDHTIDLILENNSATVSVDYGGNTTPYLTLASSHNHTGSVGSLSSSSVLPARVLTRFYKATSSTVLAPANIVCFFDDTPSSNWELITGWAGYFPMSSDSDPSATGSDTHGHDNASGTSSNKSLSTDNRAFSSGTSFVSSTHNHSFSVSIGSTDHIPLYVDLVPYRLKTTVYKPPTESNKTWSVDAVFRAIRQKTVPVAAYLMAETETVVPGSVALRKGVETAVPGSVALRKGVETAVPGSVVLMTESDESVAGSALLVPGGVEAPFGAEAVLQLRDVPIEIDASARFMAVRSVQAEMSSRFLRGRSAGSLLQTAIRSSSGQPCRISVSVSRDPIRPRYPLVRETLTPVPPQGRPSDPIDWDAIELKGREKIGGRWY